MIWFIGYICFGLLTAYTTVIYVYEDKEGNVDAEDVAIWFCFWPFVCIATIYLLMQKDD